jgi:hypothetical protein
MLTTASDARILGLANPETIFSRTSPPKLLIQDPVSISTRDSFTGTPVARTVCVSEVKHSEGSDVEEFQFQFTGRLSTSSFGFVGMFRYQESTKIITTWAVHVEQLISEVLSSTLVSDSPATSNSMANFSENALTRSI